MIRSVKRKNMWLLLSLASFLLLAFAAGGEWLALDDPIQTDVTPVPGKLVEDTVIGPMSPTSVDASQLSKVVERPLFSQNRRPPQPLPVPAPGAQAAAPPPPAPVLDFTLVGVVQVGDTFVAMVQPQDGHPSQRLKTGDAFHGWVLTGIDVDRAMFRSNGESKELVLDFRRASAPPPP